MSSESSPNIPPSSWWRHRACWLWPLTALMGLVLWNYRGESRMTSGWLGLNALLCAAMALWAVAHVRTTFKLRGTLLRWAFWPALLSTFLVMPGRESASGHEAIWFSAGPAYLISLLVVFPITMLAGLVIGVIGAGGGIMACESEMDRAAAARSGVRWLWVIVIGIALLNFVLPLGQWIRLGVVSIPWLFLCLHPFIARGKRRALIGRLDVWLARRFTWRVWGRQLDLRAEVFAAAGFLLAWAMVSLQFFVPLQASALLSSVQVMNALGVRPAPRQGEIVLLEWDAPNLREATTRQSEAAIQAKLIRHLGELGARRVVLPSPAEASPLDPTDSFEPVGNADGPLPDLNQPELNRTERDLAGLDAAMREAGNVVLLAPTTEGGKNFAFDRLRRAAKEVVSPRLQPFQSPALPAIPFRWRSDELPPAPLILFASQRERERPAMPVISSDGVAHFDGKDFPLIDGRDNLLVALDGSRGARDFARVSYSEVLRDEWQYSPATEASQGAWVPPDIYFRNKIVFLPPLRSTTVPGPLGPLETTELLAHATRTLSGNSFVRPVSPRTAILWSLACSLVIGRLAMRRDPLKAGWRLIVVIALVIAVSLVLSMRGLWLDPVWPAASALASFLLVTQLSFSLERVAKQRSRFLLHRFVDPEIARELLDSQSSRIGLGGDRENVVILFADVRGFSRFAENHSPEEVMRVVNAYLGVMTEALHARGGILDKYTGDGLMAMFRLERSGSISGAVSAALAMRDAALELSRELKAEGEKSLRVGISMHAGEAVVGLIGNSERQVNFTALGHTVVVAARLQSLTGGGEVIVSKEIYDAVSESFQMEPRPEVHVKGISQPVQPYVVLDTQ